MATTKGPAAKLARSEVVTVRLDLKLRYLLELAARKQRRTISSYIEWAIESALAKDAIYSGTGYGGDDDVSFMSEARRLWDVDDSERFIKLSIHYPDLLTHEEAELWKMINDSRLLTPARRRTPSGETSWDWGKLEDLVFPLVRTKWGQLKAAHEAGPIAMTEWVAKMKAEVESGKAYPGLDGKDPGTKKPSGGFDDVDDQIPF